ncbi:class I mannose-6-phosphate isomerase [Luteolibacter marinus]|uniref:class I mannose-6-phosphate isomerase n=1 Tax=Luteolibacter marinus TaxID=2776705 RepID=UPI001868F161|nr:class I mannose-6-phosphate isomerase [Luteolibacter marinus]
MMRSNYDKYPEVAVPGMAGQCWSGWPDVMGILLQRSGARVMVIECYVGVDVAEIAAAVREALPSAVVIGTEQAFHDSAEIERKVAPFLRDEDLLFGSISSLRMEDFLCPSKTAALRERIASGTDRVVLVGPGASCITTGDLVVFADLPRWEAQGRMRRAELSNLGTTNGGLKWNLQYKRAFFIDWPVCDRLKLGLQRVDFLLDTCKRGEPKLITREAAATACETALSRPFRVVPFFDPAPWGGQWMKRVMALPEEAPNYGWCFDCVPEENSILFRFGDTVVELPSMNVVFHDPVRLLGPRVHARFGLGFPIRFDLLDTVGGGNLSFQVHPFTDYVQRHFGLTYTQDESYYLLDAEEGSSVYLGLKEDVVPEEMIAALEAAQSQGVPFDDEKFVCRWPAKTHDHYLIPAGTCHCSGAGTLVLEISATPNIFTFKLWDWGRLGLDGQPRPLNVERGKSNIAWERRETWVERELVNAVTAIASGEGWREERTGLHELEFIETRRHWFTGPVAHHTGGGVNVLNLIEGREAVVESPTGAFEPFVVHYAETFIVPACVGPYTIRPHGESAGATCATLKAFVRA